MCVCVSEREITIEFNYVLAISIHKQLEGGEASNFKLFCQLFLLDGVHLGQTDCRLFFLQLPGGLRVLWLQLPAVATPGSICTPV